MTGIDDIIARSRRPGGFSQHRRFTVARSRAIQKMRQFALADPHYYILELIQAAVANGARYIDIRASEKFVALSYIGGYFREEELAQLFDFLFSSKENVEHSAIRSLAIGINALLLMEPEQIVVESGDGSRAGTTRLLIRGREDAVEVGKPEAGLSGTYVRAVGLDRSKIDRLSNLDPYPNGPRECGAIEIRCMAAPVPFIVNGQAIFGYSSLRTPYLLGYSRVVSFDEGDLYGSIGIPKFHENASFKLLISGVWIQSVSEIVLPGVKLGGIVAFDHLRKTVDHSGIVRDDMYKQLWVRLRPYARQVAEGRRGHAHFDVSVFAHGGTLGPRELRLLLEGKKRAVLVPHTVQPNSDRGTRAIALGKLLDAPVLRLPDREIDAVRALGGPELVLLQPELSAEELAFFHQPEVKEPPRPWLTAPVDVELPNSGEVRAKVYTEAAPSADAGDVCQLRVRVTTSNRVVWEGVVSSPHPGHLLVIDVIMGSPVKLLETARATAELIARQAAGAIAAASRRALDALAVETVRPKTSAAKIALAALERTCFARIGPGDRVRFHAEEAKLLEAMVLETAEGEAVSMRGIEELLHRGEGVLDASSLELDDWEERTLAAIVGEAAFNHTAVRRTRRDLDRSELRAKLRTLVEREQVSPYKNGDTFHGSLVAGVHGQALTFADLREILRRRGAFTMLDGRALDIIDLGHTAEQRTGPETAAGGPAEPEAALAMNPFVFHQLSKLGPVRAPLERGADAGRSLAVPGLARAAVEGLRWRGEVVVTSERPDDPSVLLVGPGYKRVRVLRGIARDYGITGRIEIDDELVLFGGDTAAIEGALETAANRALEQLAGRIPSIESGTPEHERALSVLLDYAASHIHLIPRTDGSALLEISTPLAALIADIPLFPTAHGAPVSARRLLLELCASARAPELERTELSPQLSPLLARWLEARAPVTAPQPLSARPRAPSNRPAAPVPPTRESQLAHLLEFWLEELRPDLQDSNSPNEDEPEWEVFDHAPRGPLTVALVVPTPSRPGAAVCHRADGVAREEMLADLVDLEGDWLHHYMIGEAPRLLVNGTHRLVRWVRDALAARPDAFAWLLLSAYAHMNALLSPVTNEHEMIFQRRVAELVAKGGFLDPPVDRR